jgi:hypothetical protein
MHGVYEGSYRDLIEDLEAVVRPLHKMVVKVPEPMEYPVYREPVKDELPEYYEPEPIPESKPPQPPAGEGEFQHASIMWHRRSQ